MMWSADKREKYGTPEKKVYQMMAYVKYFQDYHARRRSPTFSTSMHGGVRSLCWTA